MKLTNEQIDEFIKIYKSNCGIKLSRKAATERAIKLVLLVKALMKEI